LVIRRISSKIFEESCLKSKWTGEGDEEEGEVRKIWYTPKGN